jgi:AbiV family abortive infection protein
MAHKDSHERRAACGATVSPDLLLHRAWYALEQCGLLLCHAVVLYEEEGYPTAASLALLAHEELGKFKILLDLWRSALKGQPPTVDDVPSACEVHEQKQRKGQGGVSIYVQGGTKFAELVQKAQDRTNPDHAKARREFDRIIMKKLKSQPDQRAKLREQGFYVDLDETGTDWRLPRDIGRECAYRCIDEALGDYFTILNNFSIEILKYEEPQLESALAGWSEKPELTEPKRPAFPALT